MEINDILFEVFPFTSALNPVIHAHIKLFNVIIYIYHIDMLALWKKTIFYL